MRPAPLCGGIGTKKDKAQGRGFESRPMEVGHSRGPGEPVVQPATFYSPESLGRKGLWSVCAIRLLPDTPTFEAALTYEQEDR